MLRRIATGALVVGSAAALLIGGATYAPFTDNATGSGGVGAGSVDVTINGADTHTFDFSTDECDNMAPGHDCVVNFTVGTGDSSLSATWAATVSDDDDPELAYECFSETVNVPAGDAEDGDAHADHDPGDSHTATLTVQVADDNRCQSAATNVTVAIVATQSASPHN